MTKIVREGYFYRAVNTETGFRSPLVTSASQAGAFIVRKFGRDAYWTAIEQFRKDSGKA
jgi:hypothetical protein